MQENQEIPFIEGESLYDYEQRLFNHTKQKYGKGVADARKELSDELFLMSYSLGIINQSLGSLKKIKDYLVAAKLMQNDKSWANTEKAYSNSIDKIIFDLEKTINNYTCDISSLSKDSIFFTGIKDELSGYSTFTIRKYKVLEKRTYETNSFEFRNVFEVQELDTKNTIVGDNQFWLFLEEELINIAWDNEDEIYAFEEKHNNSEGSYIYAHKDIFDNFFNLKEGFFTLFCFSILQ